MRFILIRHGETEANIKGIYSGWQNYELTEKGVKQIEKIALSIKGESVDIIFSSPLKRAVATAERISHGLKKDIIIAESLKEINFGIFEGKSNEEISLEHKEEYKKWTTDYLNHRISRGESLRDLYDRVNNFITELKRDENNKTHLLITHGGVIRVIITILLKMDIEKIWNFKVLPGSLVEIEYNQDFGVLTKLINT